MRRSFDVINHWLMKHLQLRLEVPRDRRYLLGGTKVALDVGRRVEFQSPEKITVGNRVSINNDCYLAGDGGLSIGDDVLIGPKCMVFTMNHVFQDRARTIRSQGIVMAPVNIGNDVWIGAGSVILAGVRLGHGCVVAAGAVVNRDVSPFTVVAGAPARSIGIRE